MNFIRDTYNMCYGDRSLTCFFLGKGMRKVYIVCLFCILLIHPGFSKTENELIVFNNFKSSEITINNIQVEGSKSQKLINELKNSRKKGINKCLCLFEIEIKTDNDIIKLKSNGGKLFAFAGNDIFFEMNTDLINYINLTNISFIYKGTKYIITPNKNNNVHFLFNNSNLFFNKYYI